MKAIATSIGIDGREIGRAVQFLSMVLPSRIRLTILVAALICGCKHVHPAATQPSTQSREVSVRRDTADPKSKVSHANVPPAADGAHLAPGSPEFVPAGESGTIETGKPSVNSTPDTPRASAMPAITAPADKSPVRADAAAHAAPNLPELNANSAQGTGSINSRVQFPRADGSTPSDDTHAPIGIDAGATPNQQERAGNVPSVILSGSVPLTAESNAPSSRPTVSIAAPLLPAGQAHEGPIGLSLGEKSAPNQDRPTAIHLFDRIASEGGATTTGTSTVVPAPLIAPVPPTASATGAQTSGNTVDRFFARVADSGPTSRPAPTSAVINPGAPTAPSPALDPTVVPLPQPPAADLQSVQAARQRQLDAERQAREQLNASVQQFILGSQLQAPPAMSPATRPTIQLFNATALPENAPH